MEAMVATAPATGGGGGDERRPLAPFFLGLGAAMEEPLPFLAAAKGEANSWLLVALPKLGFLLSLYVPLWCSMALRWMDP